MKPEFGYALSGPMSKVQNNKDSIVICHSLKCATDISDCASIYQKKLKNFRRLNALNLKLTTPPFTKTFRRICRQI